MIEYKQLEGGAPPDVEVITDDADAEMAKFQEKFTVYEFEIALPQDRNEDGNFHFVIPGTEVGEVSDFTYDIDGGKLEGLLEQWNEAAIAAADEDS